MASKEDIVFDKVPWFGIIAILYGLLAFMVIPAVAKVSHIIGSEEKILLQVSIIVLIAILISHLSLFRILRRPEQYKWKAVTFVGIAISYILLIKCAIGIVVMPSMCERQLKSEIAGTTLIKVSAVRVNDAKVFPEAIDFEVKDKEKIREIIKNIKVAPFGYGDGCLCMGDQKVEFYQDGKLCVELTCHHGESLRWSKSRARGDLRLTSKSSAFLKKWLNEKGNYSYD